MTYYLIGEAKVVVYDICSRWVLRIAAILVILGILVPENVAGADPVMEWSKTFGGGDSESAYSVKQTSDGGYIMAGETSSYRVGRWPGHWDAWLIKTDSKGNETWNKTFGGIGENFAYSVQQTSDGGYIFAGTTDSYGAGGFDAWLVKTDARGNEDWNKTFGGPGREIARIVQQTSDGGYMLSGTTRPDSGIANTMLIKTDAKGNKLWSKIFKGTSSDFSYSARQTPEGYLFAYTNESGKSNLIMINAEGNELWSKSIGRMDQNIIIDCGYPILQTSDGGYIIIGKEFYYVGDYDIWFGKTDSRGNEQWSKTFREEGTFEGESSFGMESDSGAWSVQPTSDGGYVLAGYRDGALIIKFDYNGNEQWNMTFEGKGNGARSIQRTSDGGYIMTGDTYSFGAGSGDVWLIKVSPVTIPTIETKNVSIGTKKVPEPARKVGLAGKIPSERWNKTFGGASKDYANSVRQTSDDGYILAGYTESYGTGSGDAWLIKTDASGNEQWNKTFGGSGHNEAYFVQEASDGGYILAGYTNYNTWIIRTDNFGNMLWNKTIEDPASRIVQQTSDGGYILVGNTPPFANIKSTWIIKTNAEGSVQWNRDLSHIDVAYSAQQTTDGGYIIIGTVQNYAPIRVIKTDSDIKEQWRWSFRGKASEYANSIQQTSDEGYILAGRTDSYVSGKYDAKLIKIDSSGKEQWSKTFGRMHFYSVASVQQTSDGGYIFAGTEFYENNYGYACLIKADLNGDEQWNMTFGREIDENKAYSLQQTSDGGYVLAGLTNSYGSGEGDAWLIKVDGETNITPLASMTNKIPAIPKQTEKFFPESTNVTQKETIQPKKTPAFEVLLSLLTVFCVYIIKRN